MRLTRIRTLPVVTEGGRTPLGTVDDGLLDLERRRVAYWCVRMTRGNRPVLVSANRASLGEGTLVVQLPDRELLDGATDAALDEDTLATGTLPDVLAADPDEDTSEARGIGRVWSALERTWRPPPPAKPANAPTSWVWGREMTGKPFFSNEGELGRISDVEIDPANGRLSQLQVAQGGGVTLHINMSALRHIPEGHSHFVARASVARGGQARGTFAGSRSDDGPEQPGA